MFFKRVTIERVQAETNEYYREDEDDDGEDSEEDEWGPEQEAKGKGKAAAASVAFETSEANSYYGEEDNGTRTYQLDISNKNEYYGE